MTLLVIDGQGGKLGEQVIKAVRERFGDLEIIAVGINSSATAAMMKSGANQAATGENPVVAACRRADVIIGPIGIAIADSFLGEITPKMALAVAQSDAVRILIPMNKCNNLVAGIHEVSMPVLIEDVIHKLSAIIKSAKID